MIPSSSGSSRNESATADRLEIFLVCSVHKVSKWISSWTEWSMCYGDVIGMSALKSDKNACNVLCIKIIGLLLPTFIIAKIGWFKPGIRFRNFPGAKLSVDRKPIIARDLLASQITCANGKRKRMVLFLPRRGAGTAPTSIWLSIAWPLLCMSLIFLAVSLCLSISFKDREPSSCVSLVWRKRYERCLEPFSCHQSCRAKS